MSCANIMRRFRVGLLEMLVGILCLNYVVFLNTSAVGEVEFYDLRRGWGIQFDLDPSKEDENVLKIRSMWHGWPCRFMIVRDMVIACNNEWVPIGEKTYDIIDWMKLCVNVSVAIVFFFLGVTVTKFISCYALRKNDDAGRSER